MWLNETVTQNKWLEEAERERWVFISVGSGGGERKHPGWCCTPLETWSSAMAAEMLSGCFWPSTARPPPPERPSCCFICNCGVEIQLNILVVSRVQKERWITRPLEASQEHSPHNESRSHAFSSSKHGRSFWWSSSLKSGYCGSVEGATTTRVEPLCWQLGYFG